MEISNLEKFCFPVTRRGKFLRKSSVADPGSGSEIRDPG
jgi:hypothetical protein